MDHFIDHIEIRNFKSIRDLNVDGFKRINLFIGRPNVGKSNILEALSLFSISYLWNGSKELTDLVRLRNQSELFYEGNIYNTISVLLRKSSQEKDPKISLEILYNRELGESVIDIDVYRSNKYFSFNEETEEGFALTDAYRQLEYRIDSKFQITELYSSVNHNPVEYIKQYSFDSSVEYKEHKTPFLYPPFGPNLLYVLELMPDLRKLYAQWFRQYGLRLVLDTASQSLKIQKDKGDDEVFQLPYSSVADTLQRIIFYKTAVASNKNSVLLFEEPEAHAYPPYISEFTQEVIRSETNQFFVVTHSPLIVNDFLEGAIEDLAIFMVDFKDGQTTVKPLSETEIKEVHQYGVDLFFNNEAYLS